MIFLNHESVSVPIAKETVSAGLGSPAQYGLTLLALIIIGSIIYFRKRKNKKKKSKTS